MDVNHHSKTLVNYSEFLSTGGLDISQRYSWIQWNTDTSLLVVVRLLQVPTKIFGHDKDEVTKIGEVS
jgi:hypothetical protein